MTDSVKNKGVVFTPKHITETMVDFIGSDKNLKIFEPCCGKGVFLETLSEKGYKNLYANDISSAFVNECKDLFGDVVYTNEDFIDLQCKNTYDVIIGNPPYVKIQNLDSGDIFKIKNEYGITGNIDLYLYFILKCIDLLSVDGKLIFIVPNSFIYNKSCEKTKQSLMDLGYLEYVIDFRHEKIFKGYSVYTCILVINKKGAATRKSYSYKISKDDEYKIVPYKSKTIGNSLLKYINIKNGIATLRDSIFILKDTKVDNTYVYFSNNGVDYKVEKSITKKIFKVSKQEEYYIIYPYDTECNIYETLDAYPHCKEYLSDFRETLEMRDKGNKKYKKWFAYGRSQALSVVNGKRLFISSLMRQVSVSERDVDLFYSGLYIQIKPEYTDVITSDDVKKIILDKASLIEANCNVKSDGWYVISKKSFDVEINQPSL